MKNVNYKKLILPNIPYVFIGLLATKLGQAARLSPGVDFSSKAMNIMQGISMAFENIMPSFHPIDLLVGIATGVIIRLVVYFKGKNAKKFRKNLEYGSARWGTREDIAPFMDPVFENNIILTQTESLKAAKKAFDELGVKKLPTIKSLQVEFAEQLTAKKEAYAELKKVRDELRDLTVHTANYEELRDLEEREKRKEKEHGRE